MLPQQHQYQAGEPEAAQRPHLHHAQPTQRLPNCCEGQVAAEVEEEHLKQQINCRVLAFLSGEWVTRGGTMLLSRQRLKSTMMRLLSTSQEVSSRHSYIFSTVKYTVFARAGLTAGATAPTTAAAAAAASRHLKAAVRARQQSWRVVGGSAAGFANIIYNQSAIESMNLTEQVMKHEAYRETDIVKKCRKYPEFYAQVAELESGYLNELNMSIYADLEEVEFMEVLQVERREQVWVLFYGYLMGGEEQGSKFYLLWLRLLDELLRSRVGGRYSVVYFHSLCDSTVPYHFLFSIYKKLPMHYHAMLDKIITVETTYFLRKSASMFEFGRLNKLFERKFQHIEKLTEFVALPDVQKNALLDRLPDKLMLLVQEKTKKKLLKNGNLMAYHQSLPVYAQKKDYLNVDLHSYKLDANGIPIPLQLLLNALAANKHFLQLEGIFRKSGSIEEEEAIMEELAGMGEGDVFKNAGDYSGYSYAGVVKKFFTKLVNPIVPYEIYDRVMEIISTNPIKEEEELAFAVDFLSDLPALNRRLILHLLGFLREEVISRQELNKMSHYNMAVCFFPCIFKSRTISEIDLLNSAKFVAILKVLFVRFEDIAKEATHLAAKHTPSTASGAGTLKDFRMSMA